MKLDLFTSLAFVAVSLAAVDLGVEIKNHLDPVGYSVATEFSAGPIPLPTKFKEPRSGASSISRAPLAKLPLSFDLDKSNRTAAVQPLASQSNTGENSSSEAEAARVDEGSNDESPRSKDQRGRPTGSPYSRRSAGSSDLGTGEDNGDDFGGNDPPAPPDGAPGGPPFGNGGPGGFGGGPPGGGLGGPPPDGG